MAYWGAGRNQIPYPLEAALDYGATLALAPDAASSLVQASPAGSSTSRAAFHNRSRL